MSPLIAALVCLPGALVTRIFRVGRFSEVANAVVEPVIVYVINLILWPFAIVNRPDNSVGHIPTAENRPTPVSVITYRRERLFSRESRIPWAVRLFGFEHLRGPRLPIKLSSLGLIPQELA